MVFSQNQEDSILARFFGNQRQGTFVDIGAHDGITYSNTYLFERRGWQGICVEPNPQTFPLLKARRAQAVQAAIVGDPDQREATLYLSHMPELATLARTHDADIARIHGNVGLTFDGFEAVTIPAMTLDALLEQHGVKEIDLLSIDTEWVNGEVLKGFSLHQWRPRVVVIEEGDGVKEGMIGYHPVRLHSSNYFYVRDGADIARMNAAFDAPTTVSALVSTYNAEKFLRGCIDDLMAQPLYAQGRLEIIVVNSGSKQGEGRLLREYLAQGADLKVITSLREPLYAAWNRALKIATGDYVTSANTDDRHAPHALETLAAVLDNNPAVGVAYADCTVTPTENAVWGGKYAISMEAPYTTGRLNWPDYDPLLLTQACYLGPQPVWRRTLHDAFGLFDDSYLVAGDYEWWLRLAACGVPMQRVPEVLGLFYWNASQQGRAMQEQSGMESRRALLQWTGRIQATWQT